MNGKYFLACLILALSVIPATLVAEGSGKVKISPNEEKSASWIEDEAVNFLDQHFIAPISEWKLVEIILPRQMELPEGFDRHEISLLRSAHNGQTLTLAYNFYRNDKLIKKLTATAKVETYARIVVAREKIIRGQTLTEGMVTLEKRKITSPLPDLGTDIDLVIGRMAERNIQPGQEVRISNLARPLNVKTGEIVMIVAENKNVRVTSRGVAKKDGSIGQTIPVVNLRSNQKIYAEIIGNSLVRVGF